MHCTQSARLLPFIAHRRSFRSSIARMAPVYCISACCGISHNIVRLMALLHNRYGHTCSFTCFHFSNMYSITHYSSLTRFAKPTFRQDQLQHLRSDPRGAGSHRRRAGRVRYPHGKDSGSTTGETILHQDLPCVGLLQVGLSIFIRWILELWNNFNLFFYRNGNPLLYEGDLQSEQSVLEWLIDDDNRELADEIEEVNERMLDRLMEQSPLLCVFYCELIFLITGKLVNNCLFLGYRWRGLSRVWRHSGRARDDRQWSRLVRYRLCQDCQFERCSQIRNNHHPILGLLQVRQTGRKNRNRTLKIVWFLGNKSQCCTTEICTTISASWTGWHPRMFSKSRTKLRRLTGRCWTNC